MKISAQAALAQQTAGEAVGFVAAPSLDALVKCRNDVHNGYAEVWMRPRNESDVPVYLHPIPSAVEALASAADAIAERISYYAELGEHASTNIEDWAYTDGSGDIARLRAALAHPEIAALLKEKES